MLRKSCFEKTKCPAEVAEVVRQEADLVGLGVAAVVANAIFVVEGPRNSACMSISNGRHNDLEDTVDAPRKSPPAL